MREFKRLTINDVCGMDSDDIVEVLEAAYEEINRLRFALKDSHENLRTKEDAWDSNCECPDCKNTPSRDISDVYYEQLQREKCQLQEWSGDLKKHIYELYNTINTMLEDKPVRNLDELLFKSEKYIWRKSC